MTNISPEARKASVAKGVATRRANIEARKQRREDVITYRNGLKEEIATLEQKLAQLQCAENLNEFAAPLTGKLLLSEEEIVERALPWQRCSGVYFLVHRRKVVYVGQSVCVPSRVQTHSNDLYKTFDHYAYVECPEEKLDALESLYIHLLRPPLNGDNRNGAKTAPVALMDLLN